MRHPMLERLADVLVRYSTTVKKGDLVTISAEPVAMPLVAAVYEAVLAAGGHPVWIGLSEELTDLLIRKGSEEQLAFFSPLEQHRIATCDVHIKLWADVNTKSMGRVPPTRIAMMQNARKGYLKTFMERAAKGDLRWCGTQYPTQASAQDAEMSLVEYSDFVFRAGLLHEPDPVAAWKRVHERQEKVREYLQGKREIRFRVPPHAGHDGTDLTVEVGDATWINCSGKENFPDGEVFCGPQGATGHVNYTFPAVYEGREVDGVRLAFKDGRVVDASARKNEEFLFAMLDQDEGARVMGEIAIGTNYGITDFSRNTLFDEKIGGTFHAAVGAGYPESGNSNQSGLHWDMVCDMRKRAACPGGTIEADGELFHREGRFVGVPGFDDGAAA